MQFKSKENRFFLVRKIVLTATDEAILIGYYILFRLLLTQTHMYSTTFRD